MNPVIALGIGSAAMAASLVLNSQLQQVARRRGWCDPAAENGNNLKVHLRPTPFTGGLGVGAVFVSGLVLLALWPGLSSRPAAVTISAVGVVAILALGVGSWDDFHWKSESVPMPKLALQTAAAVAAGWYLRNPVAALLALGAMNAYNLADGLDGLAAGEAAISALALGLVFLNHGQRELGAVTLVLAGALAGFLVLNWHPAQVFLGDGGSHLLGAVLAGLSLLAAGQRTDLAGLGKAVLLLGMPVVDAAWIVCSRLARHRPLFAGDRCHLYDLVLRRLTVRQTVAVMWSLHALLVVLGAVMILQSV